jgi:hypothetical protein
VGEFARTSTRAPGGGARDEGGRLRDVEVPDARRRGLVIACRPSRFGWHRGTPGAGAGFNEAQAEQALWQGFRDHIGSLNRALNEALRIHGGLAWRIF